MVKNVRIESCVKCGSKDLNSNPGGAYSAQTAYGLSGAMSGKMLCNKCGNFGFPITFQSEKERRRYSIAAARGGGTKPEIFEPAIQGGKNPYLAAFFSLVIPGTGQAYAGNLKRGLLFFLGLFASFFIVFLIEALIYFLLRRTSYIVAWVPVLYWLFNIYDAFTFALPIRAAKK
jgi:TM2 domain-containing membrane protein YozV